MTAPAHASAARAVTKKAPVAIAVFDEVMQRVKFVPRSRSSPPRSLIVTPRMLTPVVSGVPKALRGVMAVNQVPHGFPQDRYCDTTGPAISDDTLRFVSMDNGRFRLLLCPGLGGRILSLVDRHAGGELLFQPPMLLSRALGLAGAWHVGGIEMMAFRYTHLLQGQARLRTTAVRLASGYDAVKFQGFDERSECSYTCVLALLPDRLAMRMTLTNHSASPQSGFYWTNIAVPANPWTHLFYPPSNFLNHGQGRLGFTQNTWPMIDGFDCRRWKNHPHIISAYCHNLQGDWMGNCDRRSGLTFAHRALRADHNGRKLWSLGSADQDRVWFDHSIGEPSMGSYVEIQSGRRAPQANADLIPAGTSISWTEECVGVVNHVQDADSTTEYKAFVKTIEASLDQRIPVRDPGFWELAGPERTLVEPDERMSLSERVVIKSAPISSAEIRQAAKKGWLAGHAWVKALAATIASGAGDAWTELAAAVATSDLTAQADPRLRALSRRKDPVGAWASYVRSLYVNAKQSLPLLRRAVALAPQERTILVTYANQLLAVGDHRTVQKVVNMPALRGSEDARAMLAEVAFAAGKWQVCRNYLEAPFQSQGEGQFRMWMMRKECDIIEGMQAFRNDGDAERALALLHEACRLRPQFGLSRDEASQSADAMFYRWAVLALTKRSESAHLAAHQLLQYPGGGLAPSANSNSVGAYALRLAVHVKSPCVQARINACVAFGKDAANDPRPLLSGTKAKHGQGPWYDGGLDLANIPGGCLDELVLRRCVLRAAAGRAKPFVDLKGNRLFGYRAELEAWLSKKLNATFAR